jgi:hypothetical protein
LRGGQIYDGAAPDLRRCGGRVFVGGLGRMLHVADVSNFVSFSCMHSNLHAFSDKMLFCR